MGAKAVLANTLGKKVSRIKSKKCGDIRQEGEQDKQQEKRAARNTRGRWTTNRSANVSFELTRRVLLVVMRLG